MKDIDAIDLKLQPVKQALKIYIDEDISTNLIYCKTKNKSFTILPPVIYCIDHIFGCYDKLISACKYINKNKHLTYINALSESDKHIIQNVINDNNTRHKKYWHYLLNKDVVTYYDGCFTKLSEDKDIIQKYDRPTTQYACKWLNLDNNTDSKINTLISNKLYLASPMIEKLNDDFDCQYRFGEDDIYHIAQETKMPKLDVSQYITLLNALPKVTSLSMHDPLITDSSFMWAHYGNNRKGIAVRYDLKEIIYYICRLIFEENEIISLKDKCRYKLNILDVLYRESYIQQYKQNLITLLKNHLQISHEQFADFLLAENGFLRTKTQLWGREKELRIVGVDNEILNNKKIQQYFGTKIDNETLFNKFVNDVELVLEEQQNDLLNNRIIPFIKPYQIVLGSECNHDNNILQVIKYCKNQNIKVQQLTGKIRGNQFEYNSI